MNAKPYSSDPSHDVGSDFSDLGDFDRAASATPKAQATMPCPAGCRDGMKTIGYSNPRTVKCFVCNGTGQVHPDYHKRKAAFQKGERTKASNLAARIAEWKATHPAELAWISAKADSFEFAFAMNEALHTYGSLTPNQLAAVQKCVAKDAARQEARKVEQKASGMQVGPGANAVLVALTHAYKGGIAPKMRTANIVFTFAKPGSRNPGCAYVTACHSDPRYMGDGLYAGKITPDGVFSPSRECTPELQAEILEICKDPHGAAIAYGRLSGTCSCCGRRLTDPVSIANGIGPICEQGFGW